MMRTPLDQQIDQAVQKQLRQVLQDAAHFSELLQAVRVYLVDKYGLYVLDTGRGTWVVKQQFKSGTLAGGVLFESVSITACYEWALNNGTAEHE
jgi:hypothetical protein